MPTLHTTRALLGALALLACSCAGNGGHQFHDKAMDFAAVRTVAILPFSNLSRDNLGGERVRDVFAGQLLSTGTIYVLPLGEVARGITRANLALPFAPSKDETLALGKLLQCDAVITGVVKEYGEVRSGNSSASVVSVSLQMLETATGKVVWSASTTNGGITVTDRLLGGGGDPMNRVTEEAVRVLLDRLFH
jgi:polysaccharide biosynthesis protein PelC